MRVGKLVTLSVTIMVIIAAGFSLLGQQIKEIRVGIILPLSGPLAPTGRELRQGFETAIDVVNNVYPELAALGLEVAAWDGIPSLGGAKLVPVFADSRGDPAVGADLARRLIEEERVVALLGAYQSSVTKTVSTVAERYGIPHINSDSSSPSLTQRGYEWFWRVTPHDVGFNNDLFNLLDGLVDGKVRGVPPVPKDMIRKLALAVENTEWGVTGGDDIARRLVPARGYDLVEYIKYPHGAPDLTSEAMRLIASGANCFLFFPYVADAILWIKTLKALSAQPVLIWGQDAGFTNPDFVKTLHKDVHGIFTRSLYIARLAEIDPIAGGLNAVYKARYGVDMVEESAREMVGVIVLAHALNNAGSTDPFAIKYALDTMKLPADQLPVPYGVEFGEQFPGDVRQNIHAIGLIGQYQYNPETDQVVLEVVYPFEWATADVIFPFPGWGK